MEDVEGPKGAAQPLIVGHLGEDECQGMTLRLVEKWNHQWFVSGHDFTACGKIIIRSWFVSGHGFSRAARRLESIGL